MRGPETATGFAVEVFVEEHVVLEVRVGGKLRMTFERRTLAVVALQEKPRDAPREIARQRNCAKSARC